MPYVKRVMKDSLPSLCAAGSTSTASWKRVPAIFLKLRKYTSTPSTHRERDSVMEFRTEDMQRRYGELTFCGVVHPQNQKTRHPASCRNATTPAKT